MIKSVWLIVAFALIKQTHQEKVRVTKTTHTLYYRTEDSDKIRTKTVPALELSNNMGVTAKAIAEGGNLVQITKDGQEYIWNNKKGALYDGAHTSNFPLQRGLIVHGGIHFAAVTPEHGLYYDIDWKMESNEYSDKSKSIVLSIIDTKEQREAIKDPLSCGPFCSKYTNASTMSKYPVTNLKYIFTITLNANEAYVRMNMAVENPTKYDAHAEGWLSMAFPIEQQSQIISKQRYRWRKDSWCFPDLPNILKFQNKWLYPLEWPSPGIFYDWPYTEGSYHAVNHPSTATGAAYVIDPTARHFSKLWSWGKRSSTMSKSRPLTEYYEPWGSGFNFAFFQTTIFEAHSRQEWNAAILPIAQGLSHMENSKLQQQVEKEIARHHIRVKSPSMY